MIWLVDDDEFIHISISMLSYQWWMNCIWGSYGWLLELNFSEVVYVVVILTLDELYSIFISIEVKRMFLYYYNCLVMFGNIACSVNVDGVRNIYATLYYITC